MNLVDKCINYLRNNDGEAKWMVEEGDYINTVDILNRYIDYLEGMMDVDPPDLRERFDRDIIEEEGI